jgi:hypothetical protein
MPEPQPARVGRPSVYSQELAERIFDEIECGVSIEKIAALPGMPAKRTIYHWRRTIPEFRRGYLRSMAFRRFDHIDEMLNVARNCSNDLKVAKLRIAVLKWLIAHDGPATMGEYPRDDGQADSPQEADRGSPVGGRGPAEPAHAVRSGSPLAKR